MTYMCDIYIYIVHIIILISTVFQCCFFFVALTHLHQTSGGDPSGLQSTGFHQVEKWISSGAAKDGEIQSGETVFGKRPGSK